jgi:PII-like signaling protein
MKIIGKTKVLRIYLDEDLKWENQLLYRAIIEKFLKMGLAGATVFKGIEGFGSASRIHSARLIELTEELPIMIEVVDTAKQVLKAVNVVEPMLPKHCLVTVQDVKVLHYHAPNGKHTKTKKLS